MTGVAFATAALVIVLSVFNGLEILLRSLYTSFDPELKIESVKGKSFEVNDQLLSSIQSIAGVKIVTEVIEDYAYVRYRDAELVVTIKGISENFLDQHRLDGHITEGEIKLKKDSIPFAIIGRGVRYTLSAEQECQHCASWATTYNATGGVSDIVFRCILAHFLCFFLLHDCASH